MANHGADDLAPIYISRRLLLPRSAEAWLPFASRCLEECLINHAVCKRHLLPNITPPSRVIDVGPLDDSKVPFLSTFNRSDRGWVTLSHCWGKVQPLKTTIDTLTDHQNALPLSKLPALFHDAVKITRMMGYRYLWKILCASYRIARQTGIGKLQIWVTSTSTVRSRSRRLLAQIVQTTY